MPDQDEAAFRRWYAEQARQQGLNADPDSQPYDYRAAFRAGAKPDASGHWPSDFKKAGHPNEVVGGFNTRTGERVPGTKRESAAGLIRLGWEPSAAERLARTPEPTMPQNGQPTVIEIPGVGVVEFPAGMTAPQIEQAAAKMHGERVAAQRNVTPARAEDFTDPQPSTARTGGPVSRFLGNAWDAIKPWDRPSDIVTGPMMAVAHPLQSIELLWSALRDAHADQGGKAMDAMRRFETDPTVAGKAKALAEGTLRSAAAVVPALGPAVAGGVDQMAEGDIAGGAGRLTGIAGGMVAGKKVPALTRPLREAAAGRLAASAERSYSQALNPTRIETKAAAQRVVPELLQRRVSTTSLEKLEDLAGAKSDAAGAKVGAQLNTYANRERDVLPMVDELEKSKQRFMGKRTDGSSVVNEPAPVEAIQKLQDTLMDYGDAISVESMAKLRRNWDETVRAARGFAVADLGTKWAAWARREGRSVLREELAKATPDIEKLNHEFSFWESVEDVANATNNRRTGQNRGLLPTIAASGGAAAADLLITGGASTAAKVGGTLLTAKLAASLRRVLDSPGYKMMSAVQKQRLADALASRNPQRIADAVGQSSAVLNGLERSAGRPVSTSAEQKREERTAER